MRKGKKIKDIAGMKYGRLTPITPTKNRKGTSVVWKCRCDCGNIVEAPSSELLRGRKKSCGCLHKETALKKVNELNAKKAKKMIGKRFGRLIVIKNTNKTKNGNRLYECLCDCGNKTYAIGRNLVRGGTKSCGCLWRERVHAAARHRRFRKDLKFIGHRFGKLVVLEWAGRTSWGPSLWKCRCDCGKVVTVDRVSLRRGDTKSCGCLVHEWNMSDRGTFNTAYAGLIAAATNKADFIKVLPYSLIETQALRIKINREIRRQTNEKH